MNIVCLDMEGVLVPEIWIAFAEESGIPELRRTTRDEPDYDKLMRWRIEVLREKGMKLQQIQDVIAKIDPLPGAKAFLDELRRVTQVVILSDTFDQFAMPLMEKLGYPTLLCNTLEVDGDGYIARHRMRCAHSKLTTVKALQSIGYDTIASGDSYNDLDMIRHSKAGFLFRTTDKIKADYPQLPAFDSFDDLLGRTQQVDSLDQPVGEEETASLGDICAAPDDTRPELRCEAEAPLAELTAQVLNFAQRHQGQAANERRREWFRLFYTEDMTQALKLMPLTFLHERDVFQAMKLPYLDYYMAKICRTGPQIAVTPLKPYSAVVPQRAGTDTETPVPLPADVSLSYKRLCGGERVGASARSEQYKWYKREKEKIREMLRC